MMYYPERIDLVFEAAMASGLPVWAGFSARRSEDGRLLSFAPEREVLFAELIRPLDTFDVAVAGVMHTRSDIIGDALDVVRGVFAEPLMAYPDSGYFAMPEWRFEDIIPPVELQRFALGWIERGAHVLGGCCGLSPEHIAALAPLKRERAGA
jgi:homocysteine S-methyltransferase